MPIYEYKCGHCRYHFEVEQRITEKPLEHCSKCGGKIHRVIFPTGIVFKGSGFHVTDYGSGSAGTKPVAKESHKEPQKESKKEHPPASHSEALRAGKSTAQEHKDTGAQENKGASTPACHDLPGMAGRQEQKGKS